MQLADRTADISPFYVIQVLKQVDQLERAGRDVIRLFVGEPDFAAPAKIVERAADALTSERQGYLSSTGLPELKAGIADRYKRWHGLDISPERIIVTPGGSTALQMAFLATLNSGDEVLLPEPGYPCNANLLSMVNARGVPVHLDPAHGMALQPEALQAAVSERSRGVLVASPSNPLGSVQSRDGWQTLSTLCRDNGLHLFADEIYHGLTFEGLAPSALEVDPDAWVIQSFSKFYGMTGWRLGWLVCPEAAVDACERIAQNLYLSSTAISQYAAVAAFDTQVEAECFERCNELKARRDYLIQALPEIGLEVMASPDGAFYLYVDISPFSNDALTFCADLLERTGVALTPGIDFGGPCPQTSVRLAYTVSVERLQEAVSRLADFLEPLSSR